MRPLWVISGHWYASSGCPIFPTKQTCVALPAALCFPQGAYGTQRQRIGGVPILQTSRQQGCCTVAGRKGRAISQRGDGPQVGNIAAWGHAPMSKRVKRRVRFRHSSDNARSKMPATTSAQQIRTTASISARTMAAVFQGVCRRIDPRCLIRGDRRQSPFVTKQHLHKGNALLHHTCTA